MKFYKSTDSVDIAAKSIGIHTTGLDDRGLCIQIRHNGNKELFEQANKMAQIIVDALNANFDDDFPEDYNVAE